MNVSSSASNWLAIGTNLAVIVGLVLVILKLNQNSELARINLLNDGNANEKVLFQAQMENVPKDIIAKSVERPEKLDFSGEFARAYRANAGSGYFDGKFHLMSIACWPDPESISTAHG